MACRKRKNLSAKGHQGWIEDKTTRIEYVSYRIETFNKGPFDRPDFVNKIRSRYFGKINPDKGVDENLLNDITYMFAIPRDLGLLLYEAIIEDEKAS